MDAERLQLYWVWCAMRYRCAKPNDRAYANYGGRGIRVCDEWMSFGRFCEDMGPRPSGGLLERGDNNGHYEPNNCRWATRTEQNSNRRNCIIVTFQGRQMTLKAACREAGLKYRPVHKRVAARGWDIDRALATPIRKGGTRASL